MRPSCPAPFVAVAAGLGLMLAAPQASQALLVYSAQGSNISGSLGSVPFSNASWTVTATADGGLSSLTTIPSGAGTFLLWSLPVSPRLAIQIPGTLLEADLLPSNPYHWVALSGSFPVGPTPKIGFVYTTPTFFPEKAAGVIEVAGSFVNLQSPLSFAGQSIFESFTYATSAGDLVITASSLVPGEFRIAPVPAPLPVLALAGAYSWGRRLRGRLASCTPPRKRGS